MLGIIDNFFNNKSYLKLILIGAVSSLAFAPLYFFIIFFITLNYLLNKLDSFNSLKESFIIGWLFGFGYFIGNCYWYCNSLLIEPLKYAWLIPFAISIIPAYLACYIGFTTLFTKYIINKYSINNNFIKSIIFSFFWVLFEYLRGIVFSGFPWNLICYSLSFSPLLIQSVSFLGCYIFSFTLLNIFTLFYVLKNKENRFYAIYYIFLILFIVVFGLFRLKNAEVNYSKYKVKLLQPNISLNDKNLLSEKEIIDNLIEQSLNDSNEIDYIIWPEATLPKYLLTYNKNSMLDYISNKLKDKTLITGGIRVDEYNEKIYNSVFIINDGKIVDYYDKYNLVPFGEFIPFRKIFPFINSITTNLDLNKSQNRRKLLTIDDKFPIFSPNICYESIFISSINKQADLIINFTNDFWFGNSSGPYQHFDALKFRAIENNIPALRIANSGITAVIDSYGRVIKKTKLNNKTYININIPINN